MRSPRPMASMFDRLKVQKPPAAPTNPEHSLAARSSPRRCEAAAAGASAATHRIATAVTMEIRLTDMCGPSERFGDRIAAHARAGES